MKINSIVYAIGFALVVALAVWATTWKGGAGGVRVWTDSLVAAMAAFACLQSIIDHANNTRLALAAEEANEIARETNAINERVLANQIEGTRHKLAGTVVASQLPDGTPAIKVGINTVIPGVATVEKVEVLTNIDTVELPKPDFLWQGEMYPQVAYGRQTRASFSLRHFAKLLPADWLKVRLHSDGGGSSEISMDRQQLDSITHRLRELT